MKKIIGILSLVLATTAFSQSSSDNINTANQAPIAYKGTMMIQERQQEIVIPKFITEENIKDAENLVKDYNIEQEMLMLDIQKIDIQIKQEMLYDTPSQRAINRLIDNKAKLVGKLEKNKVDVNFKLKKINDEMNKEIQNNIED